MRVFDLYEALGDSMSSDDYPGPGLGAAALLFRNRADRFPEFAGRDLRSRSPDTRFSNFTLDGATTRDLLEEVLPAVPGHPGPVLVTLTAGGNDAIEALNRHVPYQQALADLAGRLDRILDRLAGLFPDLALRMATVYDPTDGMGRVQSGHDRFARGLPYLGHLNRLLEDVAARHGGIAVDVHGHFLGHGLRHADPTYEHYRPDDPTGWITMDIEPNSRGASEIRRLLWNSLRCP